MSSGTQKRTSLSSLKPGRIKAGLRISALLKQSAHAFGSVAECLLLILAELQGIIFVVFRNFLRTAGNRKTSWLDRLCYPDNFIHPLSKWLSRRRCWLLQVVEMESEITSFSKFAAVWYRKATPLKLTAGKLLCSVVIQTFLFDIHFNWHPKRPILSSFEC